MKDTINEHKINHLIIVELSIKRNKEMSIQDIPETILCGSEGTKFYTHHAYYNIHHGSNLFDCLPTQ